MPPKKIVTEESSDDDEDSSSEKNKLQLHRPKIDRMLKDNINLKRITINVSMTQYPVVSEVAQQLGWRIQSDPQAGDWDIFWTDYSIDPDILIRMHFHQKINHYPGIYVIARKNLLGLNLMGMRNHFPDEYNFFPLTWMLPSQYSQFRMYYETVTKGKVRTYIVKPEAECQGRGIFLTRNIEDIENGSHYVIQRYLTKPYLIDGLKFDLRIYVLLAGTEPLRVYLFEEGLARFATEPYVEPSATNLDQMYVHLTNYAINKRNPKFVFNKSVNDMSTGHKRSLTSVYKVLERKGQNVALLKEKINQAIIKTLLTSTPLMSHQYRYSQPQQYSGNMCFHILGFDILITQSFQPLMLQVNHTPSFTTDTPLDTFIKHKLIHDTLVLMNINSKTKTTLYNKAKLYNSQRLHTGKRQIYQGEVKQKEIEKAQELRDQYENKHLGGFTKIHPVKDPEQQKKYNQILEYAMKNYQEENTLRARMEEKEAKKMLKEERVMFRQKMQEIKDQQKEDVKTTKPGSQTSKKVETVASHKSSSVSGTNSKMYSSKKISDAKKDSTHSRAGSSHMQSNSHRSEQHMYQSSVNETIGVTGKAKDHPKSLKANPSYRLAQDRNSSRGKLRKRCSEIVDLPYLPSDQKHLTNFLLMSESQLIEDRRQPPKQPSSGSVLAFKKATSCNYSTSTQTKNQFEIKDKKIRLSKAKRVQQDAKAVTKANIKSGNFVMPKIFDINLHVCLSQDKPIERRGFSYNLCKYEQ